jgi:RNA polymerase sigma-70 factor (ECF subfamily)
VLAPRPTGVHNAANGAVGKLDLNQRLMRLLPGRASAQAAAGEHAAEHDWIEQLRRAEPAAVDRLYRAEHAALRAYAQRLIGDVAAAEDLVHDVFVQLPALLARFRGGSSLRTFLFGVATQLSRRYVVTAARRRALVAREATSEELGASPESELAHAQRLQQLHAVLDALPHAQRAAFVLCEIEERSAHEAGEILRIPEATVRTRCFHARKRVQALLLRRAR